MTLTVLRRDMTGGNTRFISNPGQYRCIDCGSFARLVARVMGRYRVRCESCNRIRAGYKKDTP